MQIATALWRMIKKLKAPEKNKVKRFHSYTLQNFVSPRLDCLTEEIRNPTGQILLENTTVEQIIVTCSIIASSILRIRGMRNDTRRVYRYTIVYLNYTTHTHTQRLQRLVNIMDRP